MGKALERSCKPKFYHIFCLKCLNYVLLKVCCGKRTCPRCNFIKFLKLKRKYRRHISNIKQPKFLTLTLRTTWELNKEIIQKVRGFVKNLLRRRPFNRLVYGGFYTIEIKPKYVGWNVHVHMVADAYFIPVKLLSRHWREITKYSFVVDIREIWYRRGALSYVLKYLCKTPVMDKEQKEVYLEATNNLKIIQSFGSMYNAKIQKPKYRCPFCNSEQFVIVEFLSCVDLINIEPVLPPNLGV
ncbi:MAG: protein rep [Candidatus Thermoplasmatota archaeon]|nr:protein rep [Candidatus Thermoplasmatota archaeon]